MTYLKLISIIKLIKNICFSHGVINGQSSLKRAHISLTPALGVSDTNENCVHQATNTWCLPLSVIT